MVVVLNKLLTTITATITCCLVRFAIKKTSDYHALFLKILELLKNEGREFPASIEFMMDFEAAVWQVLKDLMPHVSGFHIAQTKF